VHGVGFDFPKLVFGFLESAIVHTILAPPKGLGSLLGAS